MKPDLSYKLLKKVENYILDNKMTGHGDSVIIGLSGGADSVCLFLLLNKLKEKLGINIYAVHVNHGIRGKEAEDDEEFSRRLCEKYGVPYDSYTVNIPELAEKTGLTLEEAGRNARYSIFERKLKELQAKTDNKESGEKTPSVKIAVAHHKNDQAETVIFNMVRGSGIKGMCGINPVSYRSFTDLDGSENNREFLIIRPLLCITRNEIEEYLSYIDQEYCTDKTNSDNAYSRNLIRNEIIEKLELIQPKAVEHISYMAEDAHDAFEYIEESINRLFEKAVSKEYYEDLFAQHGSSKKACIRIKSNEVKDEPAFIVKQLIIRVIMETVNTCKDITKTHISDIYSLFSKGKGKRIVLPYNIVAEKEKNAVVIYIEK